MQNLKNNMFSAILNSISGNWQLYITTVVWWQQFHVLCTSTAWHRNLHILAVGSARLSHPFKSNLTSRVKSTTAARVQIFRPLTDERGGIKRHTIQKPTQIQYYLTKWVHMCIWCAGDSTPAFGMSVRRHVSQRREGWRRWACPAQMRAGKRRTQRRQDAFYLCFMYLCMCCFGVIIKIYRPTIYTEIVRLVVRIP